MTIFFKWLISSNHIYHFDWALQFSPIFILYSIISWIWQYILMKIFLSFVWRISEEERNLEFNFGNVFINGHSSHSHRRSEKWQKSTWLTYSTWSRTVPTIPSDAPKRKKELLGIASNHIVILTFEIWGSRKCEIIPINSNVNKKIKLAKNRRNSIIFLAMLYTSWRRIICCCSCCYLLLYSGSFRSQSKRPAADYLHSTSIFAEKTHLSTATERK